MSKIGKQLLVIVIIDLLVIWNWMLFIKPDESVSLALIYFVPFVFLLNLIVGFILKLFKSKYSFVFFLNSVFSSILTVVLFILAIDYYENINLRNKIFKLKETNNIIYFYNNRNEYEITNSSDSIVSGTFLRNKSDTIYLKHNKLKDVYIYNNFTFNYPLKNNHIELKDL